MTTTNRADWRTCGTSWSLRPSAEETPPPVGPVMADIMIMANPAPPASCIALRQKRIIGPDLVTSTTERPVVVHPLTASKRDLENGSCKTDMKGHAEKSMTAPTATR